MNDVPKASLREIMNYELLVGEHRVSGIHSVHLQDLAFAARFSENFV
jgi:hypothetical protein